MTITDTAPPATDSTGINALEFAPVELGAGQLAAHPANPRTPGDLGDLEELAASIAQVGILEPLVVVSVEAHLAGGWPAVAEGATHVILAGHRRQAAALQAGLERWPCSVRDDLAGDEALLVMLAENDPAKRHALPVLGEARAYQQLAERGWSQRRIAERMGCRQPHVSKRIALLRLPDAAQDAIATGRLTAADGAELGKLGDRPDLAAKALEDIGNGAWNTAASVVTRYQFQIDRETAEAEARAQLEAQGIPVVAPGKLGPYAYTQRLHDGTDLEPHREAGCLVGTATTGTAQLYCGKPETHEGTPARLPAWSTSYGAQHDDREQAEATEKRERTAAARVRKAVAAQLATRTLPGPAAADLIARALLARHADASCLQTAVGWLRAAGIGPAEGSHYDYAEQVTATGEPADVRRLAVAMALAADEQAAGAEYGGLWARRQVTYLDRLIAEGGHEPGEWEQAKLTEARGRVQARDELHCEACSCRYGKGCEGYPACDVEVQDGGWQYRCSCAGKRQPDADEIDTTDDRWDALEDLLIATDPSTGAGALLPEALRGAIEQEASCYAELYNDLSGTEPTDELTTAACGVRDAALPHETDWTPQLRAAFIRMGLIQAAS